MAKHRLIDIGRAFTSRRQARQDMTTTSAADLATARAEARRARAIGEAQEQQFAEQLRGLLDTDTEGTR